MIRRPSDHFIQDKSGVAETRVDCQRIHPPDLTAWQGPTTNHYAIGGGFPKADEKTPLCINQFC